MRGTITVYYNSLLVHSGVFVLLCLVKVRMKERRRRRRKSHLRFEALKVEEGLIGIDLLCP